MKKFLLLPIVFLGFVTITAQAPTKLFDVRNGNGLTLDGVTYNRATVIVFRDNAAKNKVIQRFCEAYGYQATVPDPNNPGQTIPNPVSDQVFFNRQLTTYIKDVVRAQGIAAAADAARKTAAEAEDTDLPPQE